MVATDEDSLVVAEYPFAWRSGLSLRGEDSFDPPLLKSAIDGLDGSVAEGDETVFPNSFCLTLEALRGMDGFRSTGPESTSWEFGPKQRSSG